MNNTRRAQHLGWLNKAQVGGKVAPVSLGKSDMKTNRWRILSVALIISCVSCSGKDDQQEQVSASQIDASGADVQVDPTDFAALIDRVVADTNNLPKAEFEPAALASLLGDDPRKHFEWVRDHTWWGPYRGLLRGSRGVMLDRVGSSLDRSVLLADLLRHTGRPVRLAHAELSASRAKELLDKVRPLPERRRTAGKLQAILPERGEIQTADGILLNQFELSQKASTRASTLIRSQTDMLLAAVSSSVQRGFKEDTALHAIQDHWWVEFEQNGQWIPLDVLLPENKFGEGLVEAAVVNIWPGSSNEPSIPDENWHTVELRVVIERYEAGVTSESTVLQATLRPASVHGRPIALTHLPVPWPDEVIFPGSAPKAVRTAALQVGKWIPMLHIGRETFVQGGFGSDGRVESALQDSKEILGTGQIVSGMDMALGGFGVEEALPTVTAEWIDYEIKVPGLETQLVRRQVFDLLGPARRAEGAVDFVGGAELPMLQRAEALLSQTEILLQPCDFTGAYVAYLAGASIVANHAALKELASERDPEKARILASKILEQLDFWGPLPRYVRWRSELGTPSGDWFIDRPNILNYRISQPIVGVDDVTIRELMDVASNGIGGRPSSGHSMFAIRVQQGIADTVAEMLVLGSDFLAAGNTASVFDRLAAESSQGFIIQARDEAAVRELPWPEDEGKRVAADVDAGYMVYVPRQAVLIDGEQHVGWWRVHPYSGETIGVMDSGFHADDAEYPLANIFTRKQLTTEKMKQYPRWQKLRDRFRANEKLTSGEMGELQYANEVDRTLEYLIGLGH